MEQLKEKKYTYADYITWADGNRYELIDGVVYMMSAPSVVHQEISMEISRQLANYLRGNPCKVYAAPFDVRLNADSGDDTVVQPDISVICDPQKTSDRKSCQGAPDMVVEILSPSTGNRDQIVKLNKYMRAGVTEYWIVDPETKSVQVYIFEKETGTFRIYGEMDSVPVHVLEGVRIHFADVFPQGSDEENLEKT